jgi:AraC-like DNA-binding protein
MRAARETILIPSGHSFRVLKWEKSVRAVECITGPGRAIQVRGEGDHWHFHTEMELTLWHTGTGTRFVGDHIGTFTSGDLVLLGAKLPHYWHTPGLSSGLSLQWHFPESHPFWAFPENLALLDLFKRAGRGIRLSGQTAATVSRHLRELPAASGPVQLALFFHILSCIATAPPQDCALLSVRSFNLPLESRYQMAIAKAVRHLIAHFREQVRLDDLLRITAMSRATFARQFKQHSGRSFSAFLNHLRLQAACHELHHGDRPVLEISLNSGFTQLSFFNRLFRRELKCSPSDYRRKKQGSSR